MVVAIMVGEVTAAGMVCIIPALGVSAFATLIIESCTADDGTGTNQTNYSFHEQGYVHQHAQETRW